MVAKDKGIELPEDDPRRITKRWVYDAWRHSEMSQLDFALELGRSPAWLGQVFSMSKTAAPSAEMADLIEKASGHRVTDAVNDALARPFVDRRRRHPRSVRVDVTGLATADAVISRFIDSIVLPKVGNGPLHAELMRRRFGIGGRRAETLEQIGSSIGRTRERIRQIEARMFKGIGRLSKKDAPIEPLDAIADRVLASHGLPWDAVETQLRDILGLMPLREAMRFAQTLRGARKKVLYDDALIYAQEKVRVVATQPAHTRFMIQISTAARKFYSYAGAATVHDVRAYLEQHRSETLSSATVETALSSLPGLVWIGRGKRWFTFLDGKTLSPLLQRVSALVTLARAPVDIDTIYAGLVRETKRNTGSLAEGFIDAVPPCAIVQEILDQHPLFSRTLASAFILSEPINASGIDGEFNRAALDRMEQLGGIATRTDLEEVSLPDGRKISKYYVGVMLYLSFFIERVGPSIYAIRGRRISEKAAAAARARLKESERRPEIADEWSVTLRVNDVMRKRMILAFARRDFPADAAGDYTLPDGHVARLVDDRRGIVLRRIGTAFKSAVRACNGTLTLCFDKTAKTLTYVNA